MEVEAQSLFGPLGGPNVRTHMWTHMRIRYMCGATTHEATHVDCATPVVIRVATDVG